jgi:hypothetical protein
MKSKQEYLAEALKKNLLKRKQQKAERIKKAKEVSSQNIETSKKQ